MLHLVASSPCFCAFFAIPAETVFGHLQMECPRTEPRMHTAVPVLSTKALQHLHLWERTISVSLGTTAHMVSNGTLMTLCGTHRGVQVGALVAVVVVCDSLPH